MCTDHTREKKTCRKTFFDDVAIELLKKILASRKPRKSGAELSRTDNLIFWYLLCYCKFFDEALEQGHKKNYYMEREWRTIGGLGFCQENIAWVIVPDESYKDEFIDEFPNFAKRVRTLEH